MGSCLSKRDSDVVDKAELHARGALSSLAVIGPGGSLGGSLEPMETLLLWQGFMPDSSTDIREESAPEYEKGVHEDEHNLMSSHPHP